MPSLVIDIAFPMQPEVKERVESRIRQIVIEPPANLFFVRIKIVSDPQVQGRVVGQVYRVTLCGVGGKALADEREFLLFQTAAEEPLRLQYVAKRLLK